MNSQNSLTEFRIFTKYPSRFNLSISFALILLISGSYILSSCSNLYSEESKGIASLKKEDSASTTTANPARVALTLDTVGYDRQMQGITNGDTSGRWPVKSGYPNAGAILPYKRIVAYYGNLYSKRMGVLGEYPEAEMVQRLKGEIKKWEAADSSTPVQPALHYIAVTAQGYPGKDNKYRLRMPFKQIDSVLRMAERINAIVFLDIQVGLSTVQQEIPLLEPYLKMPQVHLGIDPEFSMKTGKKPGTVIGTMDATDVNFAKDYLAKIVKENNIPPKILVVHRFTQAMITNYKKIQTSPDVQIVMDMDGWGAQSRKITTYREFIAREPVQYTGFKLFYKNDFREANSRMLTPDEVLRLKPRPVYIQYQ